jgi:exopolysaccharide biosynthesis polyprenyl glycosylphosphotransferase
MALTLAFIEAALILGSAYGILFLEGHVADPFLITAQAALLASCALFALHLSDLYDLRRVRRFGGFVSQLPKALIITILLVGGLREFVPALRLSEQPLAICLLFGLLLVVPLRIALHRAISSHPFSRRVLVLGTTELAERIVRELLAEPDLRDVVVGVADDGSAFFKPTLPSLRLGSIENLADIIKGFEPDLIVCALSERHDPVLLRELLKPRARAIPVEDGIAAYERLTGKVAIEYATPRAVLISGEHQASWFTLIVARAISIVAAITALVLTGPLMALVAVLIKLDSEGPVFFLHERIGIGGRPFFLIKFRTMTSGGTGSEWAADNEHRTTRVGRILRRFRIDELPQFFNVLQGDMNLVGPRPHPVTNFQLFTERIPYYGVRCSIRPGITGWAQIRYGYANNLQEETEKMRYDLHYIKHMSLGLDLRILFETVKVIVTGSRTATLTDEPHSRLSPIYFGSVQPEAPREAESPVRKSAVREEHAVAAGAATLPLGHPAPVPGRGTHPPHATTGGLA